MSAFVVDPQTISNIVSYFYTRRNRDSWLVDKLKRETEFAVDNSSYVQDLGQAMYNMNINAVSQRYPNDTINTLPGSYTEDNKLLAFKYKFNCDMSRVWAIKALESLLYQCSEGNVEDTKMFKFWVSVKHSWAMEVIRSLPEYEKAPWS